MKPISQREYLSVLTHAPAEKVQSLAEAVLAELGDVTVLRNRTGLVMMPFVDSAHGHVFHLGEALVAEAHIRLPGGTEGYGMIVGRDLLFAMGVAVLDAALTAGVMVETINGFVRQQQQVQHEEDDDMLRKVESTRVVMETF